MLPKAVWYAWVAWLGTVDGTIQLRGLAALDLVASRPRGLGVCFGVIGNPTDAMEAAANGRISPRNEPSYIVRVGIHAISCQALQVGIEPDLPLRYFILIRHAFSGLELKVARKQAHRLPVDPIAPWHRIP